MSELIELLQKIREDVDFENEDSLIDNSVLDSFDIITIVSELNEHYGIEISVDDLVPENFNSASAILNLINKLKN